MTPDPRELARDITEKEAELLARPHRALALLKDLYRLRLQGTYAAALEEADVWRKVRELLAEETSAEVRP